MKQKSARLTSPPRSRTPTSRQDASRRSDSGKRPWQDPLFWAGLIGLVVLVAIVYWPTLDNGLIWDDETYLENNVTLRSLGGLRDIWFKIGAVPQYYPLVHTTFWIENHLWGLDPTGFHFVNLALHAASAVLLWRLLVGLQVPGAWLAAAIFAVHPVHVETVAWITERKNVLSCLFGLGAIWAYLRFSPPQVTQTLEQQTNTASQRWWLYVLALLLYILALLSKTVACSVPAVLLVIYWWKRGRLDWREATRLIPFFAVGLTLAGLTVWMERVRVLAVGDEWGFSPFDRVLIAGRALWFYAAKLVWPSPLIFFYPRWTIDDAQWWQYLYPAAALVVIVALWLLRKRIGRGPLAAVLIFAGVLVPALGFFNVYPFRFSFVADHFQYHASIALIALAAAGVAIGMAKLGRGWAMPIAAIVVLLPLTLLAHQRTYVYRGLESLYEDTIVQNPSCWAAHHNLGSYLETKGDRARAINHYREAVRLDPEQARLRTSLGIALSITGQHDEAAAQLTAALADNPDVQDRSYALTYLGNIRTAQKRYQEASSDYQAAIAAMPDNWLTFWFYAASLAERGDTVAAVEKLRAAVQLNPGYPEGQNKLGRMLLALSRTSEAVGPLEKAVQLTPQVASFRNDLGAALFQLGELVQAETQLRAAIELDPRIAHAHNVLGAVFASRNDLPGAIAQFQAALRIDPNFADARHNLERAIQDQRALRSK